MQKYGTKTVRKWRSLIRITTELFVYTVWLASRIASRRVGSGSSQLSRLGLTLFGLSFTQNRTAFPAITSVERLFTSSRPFVTRKHSGSASPHLQWDSCSSSQMTLAFVWNPRLMKNAFRFGMPAWFFKQIHGSVKGPLTYLRQFRKELALVTTNLCTQFISVRLRDYRNIAS